MTPNTSSLLTVREAAALLRTNQATVYTLIHSGLLPALKLGAYKVRPEAISKFLEQYEGKDVSNPYNVIDLN